MTEMALKALSTLNVRRAEKFPRFTNSVTYLGIFFEREIEKILCRSQLLRTMHIVTLSMIAAGCNKSAALLNMKLLVAMSATIKLLYFLNSYLVAHWPCRHSKRSLPTTPCYFIQTSIMSKNRKPEPRFGSIHSRHDDNTEIQPVPRVSQEGELAYAETSSQDFDEGLKGVDSGKCVPVEKQTRLSVRKFSMSPHVCVSVLLLDSLKRLCPFRRLDLCHECTVGNDGAHDHKTEQRSTSGQGSCF